VLSKAQVGPSSPMSRLFRLSPRIRSVSLRPQRIRPIGAARETACIPWMQIWSLDNMHSFETYRSSGIDSKHVWGNQVNWDVEL
jgi:hypothetical protein